MMRAAIHRAFGSADAVHVESVPKPAVADDAVLVAVRAAAVNMFDWYMVRGLPFVSRFMPSGAPKPIGVDMAGEVEAVGGLVTRFKPGDYVFGMGRDRMVRPRSGSFSEYVAVRERAITLMPRATSFADAAASVMAGLTALQGLREHGRLQRGEKVLVNGASGGIGTYGVQIAKAMGADVTGVCSSRNVDMVRSLGVDRVIDYTREDFTTSAERYDLILDMVCNHTWGSIRRVLTDNGRYVLCGGPPSRGIPLMLRAPFIRGKLRTYIARGSVDALEAIRDLMESGAVRSVIDRRYGLDEVPDALRYVAAGHTQGKVVIEIQGAAHNASASLTDRR
jgi:NADPH:quinone reductase-like Zn-dependent oxidoreductase